MIALATFLARILPAFGGWIMLNLTAWHVAAFAGIVALVVVFLDKVLLALAWVGGLLLEFLVRVGAAILIYLLGMLPNVPAEFPGVAWQTVIDAMAFANRYVPVDMALDYVGILVSIYSLLLTWKLVKFIRGS